MVFYGCMNKVNPNHASFKVQDTKKAKAKRKLEQNSSTQNLNSTSSKTLQRVSPDRVSNLNINHSNPVANHDSFALYDAQEKTSDYDKLLKPFYDHFKKNAPELVELLKKTESADSRIDAGKYLMQLFDHPSVSDNKSMILSLQKIIKAKLNKTPLSEKDIDNTWQKSNKTSVEVKAFKTSGAERKENHENSSEARKYNQRYEGIVNKIVEDEMSKSDTDIFLDIVSKSASELLSDLKELGTKDTAKENQEILTKILKNPKLKNDQTLNYAVNRIISEKAKTQTGTDQDVQKQIDRALFLIDLEVQKQNMISKFQTNARKLAMENLESMMEIDSYFDNIGTVTSSNNTVNTSAFYSFANQVQSASIDARYDELITQEKNVKKEFENASKWEKLVSFSSQKENKELEEARAKALTALKAASVETKIASELIKNSNGTISTEKLINYTKKAIEKMGLNGDEAGYAEMYSMLDERLAGPRADNAKVNYVKNLTIAKNQEEEQAAVKKYKADMKKALTKKSAKEVEEISNRIISGLRQIKEPLISQLKRAKTKEEREEASKTLISRAQKQIKNHQELSKAVESYILKILEDINKTKPLAKTQTTDKKELSAAGVALGGGAATAAWMAAIEKDIKR